MKTRHFQNLIATILLILLLCSSCAQQQPKPTKEVSISWSEIEQGVGLEVGDKLEVVLKANPSTGYAWDAGFYNETVLRPYGVAEFSGNSTSLGAEETQLLHFEAIGEGKTDLVLVYRRPFDEGKGEQQTFQVHVTVE